MMPVNSIASVSIPVTELNSLKTLINVIILVKLIGVNKGRRVTFEIL